MLIFSVIIAAQLLTEFFVHQFSGDFALKPKLLGLPLSLLMHSHSQLRLNAGSRNDFRPLPNVLIMGILREKSNL